MPIIPASLPVNVPVGVPSTRRTPPTTALMVPPFSVKTIVASGRKPMSHGLARPVTTFVEARVGSPSGRA